MRYPVIFWLRQKIIIEDVRFKIYNSLSMQKHQPILLSGIQLSGELNIGHYLGAIKNWKNMQHNYDCLFLLVDLHTITVTQNPKEFHEHCYKCAALYLACGLDAKRNLIFCQSHVPQHSQLMWILNCYTYMGELNRMTQFKDKSKQHATNINVGLFDYPVLMAADILLYQSNLVPVGADQKQHIEITRDLALRFNNLYGNIFTVPEIYTPPLGARIMALQEPEKKMSKSDANPNNTITLLDSPDIIRDKLKRAVTDSDKEVYADKNKPGITNLLTIFAAITEQTIPQLENIYRTAGYSKFKNDVAEAIIEFLAPVQQRYHSIYEDKDTLNKILKQSAEIARSRAQKTLDKVHEALGFIL